MRGATAARRTLCMLWDGRLSVRDWVMGGCRPRLVVHPRREPRWDLIRADWRPVGSSLGAGAHSEASLPIDQVGGQLCDRRVHAVLCVEHVARGAVDVSRVEGAEAACRRRGERRASVAVGTGRRVARAAGFGSGSRLGFGLGEGEGHQLALASKSTSYLGARPAGERRCLRRLRRLVDGTAANEHGLSISAPTPRT